VFKGGLGALCRLRPGARRVGAAPPVVSGIKNSVLTHESENGNWRMFFSDESFPRGAFGFSRKDRILGEPIRQTLSLGFLLLERAQDAEARKIRLKFA